MWRQGRGQKSAYHESSIPHQMNVSPNIQRVLKALNANRAPGWQFPAHYLGLAFEQLTERRAEVSMRTGPHCIDAQRKLSLEALGVLVDVAMAGAVRGQMGASARVDHGQRPT
ncbi:hypothetical protein D3C86_1512800 [compost metagenome]